jgi:hypothetical protein
MSQPPAQPQSQPVPVILTPVRQPLSLPAGSVRVSLILLICLPFWVLLAVDPQPGPMPLYLYFLLSLVLVYFAWHEDERPWYMPWWFFPALIILVSGGLIAYRFKVEGNLDRLVPPKDHFERFPYLALVTAGAYIFGSIVGRWINWRQASWFQDVQASVSLLAMLLLAGMTIVELLVKPTLVQDTGLDNQIMVIGEYIVVGIIAWYFGTRS